MLAVRGGDRRWLLDGVRRCRGPRVSVAAVATVAAAISLAACTTAATTPPTSPASAHPHTSTTPRLSGTIVSVPITTSHFFAIWNTAPDHTPVVEEFSAVTGKPIRQVARLPGASGSGWAGHLVQAQDGWIWFSESRGPRYRSDTAGGDPAPNSCSGAAVEFDPATGKEIVVFRTPRSVWFGAAVPSPNGRYVAYETGPCARSYFNAHIEVRDLRSGRQWSIGEDARVCHDLSSVTWTPDSARLVFGFGPSALGSTQLAGMGYGVCAESKQDELANVSALRPASMHSVSLTPAPAGCSYVEAAPDAWGVLALEACGDAGGDLGRDAIVQLNARLSVIGRWRLPPQADGTSLSVNPNGRLVLIDEYEAPIHQGLRTVQQQMDWIELFSGSRLHLVRRVLDGSDSISEAVW